MAKNILRKEEEKQQITKSGLKLLKTELEERIEKKSVLKASIEEMRDRGDLSENDGYTLALDDNESNERRIAEIEFILKNADVIDDAGTSFVSIGNSVDVEFGDKKATFMLVGDAEADPLANKISSSSPLGSALINKKIGEKVKVQLPKSEIEYKIVKIS